MERLRKICTPKCVENFNNINDFILILNFYVFLRDDLQPVLTSFRYNGFFSPHQILYC